MGDLIADFSRQRLYFPRCSENPVQKMITSRTNGLKKPFREKNAPSGPLQVTQPLQIRCINIERNRMLSHLLSLIVNEHLHNPALPYTYVPKQPRAMRTFQMYQTGTVSKKNNTTRLQ